MNYVFVVELNPGFIWKRKVYSTHEAAAKAFTKYHKTRYGFSPEEGEKFRVQKFTLPKNVTLQEKQ